MNPTTPVPRLSAQPQRSCHCEPVLTLARQSVPLRISDCPTIVIPNQCSHWCGNPSPRPRARRRGTFFYVLPPAGYFCLQRQKYPKTPLETTFQDFLSALRPVSNLPHVPRVIGFSVYRCRSKGLCHHSFPLSLPVATVGAFPSTAVTGRVL